MDPGSRAPRLGPWAFSISVVDSLGISFVGGVCHWPSILLHGTRAAHGGSRLVCFILERLALFHGPWVPRLGPRDFRIGDVGSLRVGFMFDILCAGFAINSSC